MSVAGTITVEESDDARYVVGQTYPVRLYADQHYDLDNEQAVAHPILSTDAPAGSATGTTADPPAPTA